MIGVIDQVSPAAFQGVSEYSKKIGSAIMSPKKAKGIMGWEFDIVEGEDIVFSADITDHYTEDGGFLNDHVVIKPKEITLTGYIGELVYKKPAGITNIIGEVNEKLEIVDGYLGEYSPQMLQDIQGVLSQAEEIQGKISDYIDKTKNIVDLFSGQGQWETRQQKLLYELRSLMETKEVVTVQTELGYYENMLIVGLTASQGESKGISNISVSLKEIRFAKTKTTEYNEELFPSRNEMQKDGETDQGNVKGKDNTSTIKLAVGGKIF